MLEKDCRLCSKIFETTKLLKNHISGFPHHQTEAICPWCSDNPIRYRRITELKEHAAGCVHKEILKELRPGTLSEGNGYYVS